MKKCPKCKESIKADAKKCKHCKSDLRNWFVRHKILTAILVILILGAISNKNNPKPPSMLGENCNAVEFGMTAEQVTSLLGEPNQKQQTELKNLGKFEAWHYREEGLSLKRCVVHFNNQNKVHSKVWHDL